MERSGRNRKYRMRAAVFAALSICGFVFVHNVVFSNLSVGISAENISTSVPQYTAVSDGALLMEGETARQRFILKRERLYKRYIEMNNTVEG